jgi:phage terminase large subunit-like protein
MTTSSASDPTPPLHQTLEPNTTNPEAWNYVEGAWFDQDAVDRVVEFFGLLRHTIGRWAGSPFELLPWQYEYVIRPLFGWKRADGTRLYRRTLIEVPRKAGKSTLSSGISLYMLLADKEPGAECYAAAGSRDQAGIVYNAARTMATNSPPVARRVQPFKTAITVPATGSTFRAISSRDDLAMGLNPHFYCADELHVHRDGSLLEALESATGARRQPLGLTITTADEGRVGSVYDQRHEEVLRQAQQLGEYDSSLWGVIWAAPDDADPFDESVWMAAHPGLQHEATVTLDYYREQAKKARNTPSYLPAFERLLLNRRTKASTRWLSTDDWDACSDPVPTLEGRTVWAGLDLSTTTDLTALVLVAKDGDRIDIEPVIWAPADNLAELEQSTGVPLQRWAAEGHLKATPGNVIDYDDVYETIIALARRYQIRGIGYDPYNATSLVQRLEQAGLTMVPLRQGAITLSAPAKELERLVKSHSLRHGGHPVMRWMASVVEVSSDSNGNIRPMKPDRRKSSARIDGMAALIDAMCVVPMFPDKKRRGPAAAGF